MKYRLHVKGVIVCICDDNIRSGVQNNRRLIVAKLLSKSSPCNDGELISKLSM